ncbi:hypothetical protein CI610_03499 [invertebrate metagenome]|uniref:Uncharacterized protein n=1 Tax=invertebrate metagenome TaxID=1711999 RepID=A0A2H9T2W7_9ZZZZ
MICQIVGDGAVSAVAVISGIGLLSTGSVCSADDDSGCEAGWFLEGNTVSVFAGISA